MPTVIESSSFLCAFSTRIWGDVEPLHGSVIIKVENRKWWNAAKAWKLNRGAKLWNQKIVVLISVCRTHFSFTFAIHPTKNFSTSQRSNIFKKLQKKLIKCNKNTQLTQAVTAVTFIKSRLWWCSDCVLSIGVCVVVELPYIQQPNLVG